MSIKVIIYNLHSQFSNNTFNFVLLFYYYSLYHFRVHLSDIFLHGSMRYNAYCYSFMLWILKRILISCVSFII